MNPDIVYDRKNSLFQPKSAAGDAWLADTFALLVNDDLDAGDMDIIYRNAARAGLVVIETW
jgi:hypothetical protein